jgi:hypothetical protein
MINGSKRVKTPEVEPQEAPQYSIITIERSQSSNSIVAKKRPIEERTKEISRSLQKSESAPQQTKVKPAHPIQVPKVFSRLGSSNEAEQ